MPEYRFNRDQIGLPFDLLGEGRTWSAPEESGCVAVQTGPGHLEQNILHAPPLRVGLTRGSKYPNSRVSRSKNHSGYGCGELKPCYLGTRAFWVLGLGILEFRYLRFFEL